MPPFKDENILIIAPGSQTTLAQLGLPESFTPASHKLPTRMFLAPDGKTWEPFRIRTRKKDGAVVGGGATSTGTSNGTSGAVNGTGAGDGGGDVSMSGTGTGTGNETSVANGEGGGEGGEEEELIEDPEDDEGAVYPLKEGRIDNKDAFFAFLQHVHNTLSPQLHTPVLIIAQPAWTAKNHEDITSFIFERFKTPALCIMDSALATSYAFGIAHATIVDVGYEKVDVTAITDYQISGRGTVSGSGGEAMTQRLKELLKSKGFTRDMAEQLKRSPICEILTPGTPLPGTDAAPEEAISNPAAAASTGAIASGPDVKITDAPRAVEIDPLDDEEDRHVDDEGVLDVASIVTSGKTQEFLAKKEKEKQERAAVRKANKDAAAEAAAAAAKPARLPNSKRPRAVFHYEEMIKDAPNAKRQKTPEPESIPAEEPAAVVTEETKPEETKPAEEVPADPTAPVDDDATRREQQKATKREEKRKAREEENPGKTRTDFEIGTERFLAADEGYLDAIADTVYRTVLSVDEISKRQDAWDALVVCGMGSKVRGFKDALLTTLNNRYLVSPSSATMFMSELPSNLATPSGTGSMTPTASFSSTPHLMPSASAVNPLLLAATTASNPALNPNISQSYQNSNSHSSHSQSPTSIKIVSPPTYFPEWKSFDEAVFLGAQVAAKVIFVVDQGLSKGFLSRVEFNEEGPTAIHQIGMVY